MKTIALDEPTFERLKRLKEEMKENSFKSLIVSLIQKHKKVPKSMFGSLKGRSKSFTRKEREDLWEDELRFA